MSVDMSAVRNKALVTSLSFDTEIAADRPERMQGLQHAAAGLIIIMSLSEVFIEVALILRT